MAKIYLRKLNAYSPILATLFFTTFSGFGWILFFQEKLVSPTSTDQYAILAKLTDSSYWDIGYAQGCWIWLWFRPITLGFSVFFTLIYLLRRDDMNIRSYLLISYLTTLSLAMVHFSELVFYAFLLLMLSLFLASRVKLRLELSSFTLLLASSSFFVIAIVYNIVLGMLLEISLVDMIVVDLLALGSFLFMKFKDFICRNHSVLHILKKVSAKALLHYISSCILIIWFASLLYWLLIASDFHVWTVSSVLGVPWVFYPALLGVCGILVFPAVSHIISRYTKHFITVFVVMFFSSILFGRLLTYINVNYTSIGYWERRIVPLAFSASAILSSLLVAHTIFKVKRTKLMSALLASLLVIGGMTSTLLTLEFQFLNIQRNTLTTDEQIHVNLLNKCDPNAYLLTFSSRSLKVAEFVPFAWRIGYLRYHIWAATSPELAMNALFSTGHPLVVYLTERDYVSLSKAEYNHSYVMNHLLNLSLHTSNSEQFLIYEMEPLSPPVQSSDVVLILPNEFSSLCSTSYLYAYDILSLAGINYTTAYISDFATIAKTNILVVPNEKLASLVLHLRDTLKLSFTKLVILNIDGMYGELARVNYPVVNVSLMSTSFGCATLKEPLCGKVAKTICKAYLVPFVIEIRPQNNSFVLADDSSADIWAPSAWLNGSIGVPVLSDDYDRKVSGRNSLRIHVGNGSYAQWAITWHFKGTVDISNFDFITFYWYGRGDWTRYVVQITTASPSSYFWYEFIDNWKGWKKVILPMHIPDGVYTLYGVRFSKITEGLAEWQSVKSITLKLSATNLNVGGTFYIDRFAIEKSMIVLLKITIHGPLEQFDLMNLIGSSCHRVTRLHNRNESTTINEYWLPDGTPVSNILGCTVGNATLLTHNSTYFEAFFRIKVPIPQDYEKSISIAFRVDPKFSSCRISTINLGCTTLKLPFSLEVMPLNTDMKVTAYYGNKSAFFAAESLLGDFKLIYLNFHPLIKSILQSSPLLSCRELRVITKLVLNNLPLFTPQASPINAGNTAAFKQAILHGNISVKFDSIMIKVGECEGLKLSVNGESVNISRDILVISTFGTSDSVLIAMHMEISPGKGFYIFATIYNATLTFRGSRVCTILLFKNDSFIHPLSGNALTIKARKLVVLFRHPQIAVNGKGKFVDMYTYHELNRKVKALGTNCEINGYITFEGIYGDTYTIVKSFDYDGEVKLSTSIYGFDEFEALVEMSPYMLILTLYYIMFSSLGRRESSWIRTK